MERYLGQLLKGCANGTVDRQSGRQKCYNALVCQLYFDRGVTILTAYVLYKQDTNNTMFTVTAV